MNPKRNYLFAAALILATTLIVVVLIRDSHEVLYRNHPVSYWTAQLGNMDPNARNEAVAALKDLGQNAIPALEKSVRRKRWSFENPLGSVSRYFPRTFVERMRRLLGRDDMKKSRLSAIRGLEMLGPDAAAAIPALESALTDGDINISTAAAVTLARIGASAVPALITGVRHRNPIVEANACYALGLMGSAGKAAITELWKLCERDVGGAGLQACDSLGKIQGPAAPFLTRQLDGPDPRLRGLAAHALSMMGPYAEEAIPSLVRHAKDDDNTTRQRIVHALANIQPSNPAAAEALLNSLDDPQQEIRLDALRGLWGAPRAIRSGTGLLVRALGDRDAAVRGEAALVLGQLGAYGTNVIPDLRKLLTDPDQNVRQKAEQALKTINLSLNK